MTAIHTHYPSEMQNLAYFVPEFPAQTHAFFWRELSALEDLGISTTIISTRKPDKRLVVHEWTNAAVERTSYLVPLRLSDVVGVVGQLLRSGPIRWIRCFRAMAKADGSLLSRAALLPYLAMGAELGRRAKRAKCGHIHVHSCGNAALIAMFAYLLTDIPYSIVLHGPRLADYGPNQPLKWRHARFALVVTKELMSEVEHAVGSVLPDVVNIAPMGVDLKSFARQSKYIPWDGKGPFRVFSCGRLNPVKAHDDLIRAIHTLVLGGLDVHLRIAGADDSLTGAVHNQLSDLIAELGLSGRVDLLGAVGERGVRAELERAHVFALASLREGVPVSIMEAMAMELPVVATNTGGVHELIDDQVNGVLVEPRAIGQMAEALSRVAHCPDVASVLSRASRETIAARFHSGVSAALIKKHLDATSLDARCEVA